MNILILGSNSFTARSFINLSLKNKFKVIGVSRSKLYNKSDFEYNHKNFKFIRLDVNKNFLKLKKIILKYKPSIIVNYTAQGEVRNSWIHPDHWFKTNFEFVYKLSNFLVKKKFLKKFIHISTPEVYGSIDKKTNLSSIYNPSTPYAVSKSAGDLHLISIFKRYKFPVIFTRSTNVYGAGQQLFRIIPKSIIKIKKNEKIILNNFGNTKRDFIHVSDVAKFTLNCIKKGKIGSIYHCSSLRPPIRISKLVRIICQIKKIKFKKFVLFQKENYGQDNCYYIDSSKTVKTLQWKPKISLTEGIKDTMTWIDNNWSTIKKKNLNYKHLK